MIKLEDFNNDYTLNIFVDGTTIRNVKGHCDMDNMAGQRIDGAYGAIAVRGFKEIIDAEAFQTSYITNNLNELRAIKEGVLLAIRNRYKFDCSTINLFSDSNINLVNIKQRAPNWKIRDNKILGVNKGGGLKGLKGEEIYSEMYYLMKEYNIHINFYHCMAHVRNTTVHLEQADHMFKASNGIRDIVDPKLIGVISEYNNYIDDILRQYLYNRMPLPVVKNEALRFIPRDYWVLDYTHIGEDNTNE
jgi:ribonuclease HI